MVETRFPGRLKHDSISPLVLSLVGLAVFIIFLHFLTKLVHFKT